MSNILVSGSSGIIGYGILRSLRASGTKFNLIGTTIYSDSPAEGFCDVFELAVPTNETGYIHWLKEIILKHKIDFIIPGIEADMYKWVEHIFEIEKTGVKVLLNNIDLITSCYDKWNFYQILSTYKSPHAISTTLNSDYNVIVKQYGLPFLVKPRTGHGSKGIVRINDYDSYLKVKDSIGPTLMVQPIVGNDNEEYTTSAFCDGKGGFYNYMTLKRKLSKDGFTEKAEVIELDSIDDTLNSLCSIFKPLGPTNFQFRRQDGILKLLEINPRISSSTSIRTKFGYNEALMAVDYYLHGIVPSQPEIKKGKAIRYIEDLMIYE